MTWQSEYPRRIRQEVEDHAASLAETARELCALAEFVSPDLGVRLRRASDEMRDAAGTLYGLATDYGKAGALLQGHVQTFAARGRAS